MKNNTSYHTKPGLERHKGSTRCHKRKASHAVAENAKVVSGTSFSLESNHRHH